jgi:hypothetical protein
MNVSGDGSIRRKTMLKFDKEQIYKKFCLIRGELDNLLIALYGERYGGIYYEPTDSRELVTYIFDGEPYQVDVTGLSPAEAVWRIIDGVRKI